MWIDCEICEVARLLGVNLLLTKNFASESFFLLQGGNGGLFDWLNSLGGIRGEESSLSDTLNVDSSSVEFSSSTLKELYMFENFEKYEINILLVLRIFTKFSAAWRIASTELERKELGVSTSLNTFLDWYINKKYLNGRVLENKLRMFLPININIIDIGLRWYIWAINTWAW